MLSRLLSNDYPRSRLLAVLLVAILLALAFTPFIFPGIKALNVAAKILVFVVLVASFDLLLGYTGIVSFAHTMFFGIGAYGIAVASTRMGPGWSAILVGLAAALALSFLLALAVGLFSLRVRAIFFSLIRKRQPLFWKANCNGGCGGVLQRLSGGPSRARGSGPNSPPVNGHPRLNTGPVRQTGVSPP